MSDSNLMQYSPQQTQHDANQAKCISIHTSMLAYVVQWAIAAYFIRLLSLSEKKNPEELIWKSRKYHSLIFSNSNPPWLVIPRTASLPASSPHPPPYLLLPAETWWRNRPPSPPTTTTFNCGDAESLTCFAERGLTTLSGIHATQPQPGSQPPLITLAHHCPPRLILLNQERGTRVASHQSEREISTSACFPYTPSSCSLIFLLVVTIMKPGTNDQLCEWRKA